MIKINSSLLKCLLLMVASVVKDPTMIRVTLLCGRVLSGRALWRLLSVLTSISQAFRTEMISSYFGANSPAFTIANAKRSKSRDLTAIPICDSNSK